jgi:hypothetical protein
MLGVARLVEAASEIAAPHTKGGNQWTCYREEVSTDTSKNLRIYIF